MEVFYWLICALLCPPSTLTRSPWPSVSPCWRWHEWLIFLESGPWVAQTHMLHPGVILRMDLQKRTTSHRCMLSPNNSCVAQSWPLDYGAEQPKITLPMPSALLTGMLLVLPKILSLKTVNKFNSWICVPWECQEEHCTEKVRILLRNS